VHSAILSTFPPRACGIGVFSSDLRAALLEAPGMDDVGVVVVVDEPSSPQRTDVLATVSQSSRGDYVRAARLLGRLDIDVVLLQHEYGIYGGAEGEYVLSFARELSQPLVVSLHTLLSEPAPHQLEVLGSLCREAERVIVMTETARRLLIELDACPAEKIRIVPHGVPAVLGGRRAEHAAGRRPVYVMRGEGGYEGMQSRFLLSTFGLLSAGKGLETALEALPAIVEQHPDVLYMIVGRTHPQVERREGERYRLQLERQVIDLGLEEHVAFDDRFLSIDELADLLAATDVFVTPYRNREQIASGALTFALAAGCAAVSTPYWYAEEVLASGAGTTVPFGDPGALADAVCSYIEQPELLAAARAEARRIGSELRWSSVAESTADVLGEAVAAAPVRARIPSVDLRLDRARTDHLHTLVDDVGIVQHAYGVIPNWSSGYCVDDVARLALVALELERREGDERWTAILHRALAFLLSAAEGDGPGMRNFLSFERRWLDDQHVGDHVGRSIWALGEILSTAWVQGVVGPAGRLLISLVASLNGEVSLRTAAYATLGLARLDPDRLEPDARRLLERLVGRLEADYARTASGTWRWFEDDLGYDNARLSQALIVGGEALGSKEAVAAGLESLSWLGDESGLADGMLRLTGHLGRSRNEPVPGRGDEQPLDAAALVEAELAAFAVTRDPEHGARARTAFEWFLGRNRLSRPLYDFATGGCGDGLGHDAINENEGAESTLAFHRAQLSLDAAELPVVVRHRIAATALAAA
jgi:glycosyltransferase involved in cell wall biosynthesis